MADLCEKMARVDQSTRRRAEQRRATLERIVQDLAVLRLAAQLQDERDALRQERDELRSAAQHLSALLETVWCPDHWPDDLKRANNEVRRLTDNLGDLP